MIKKYKRLERNASKNNLDFRLTIPKYSDEQIVAILKQRTQYMPEVAQLAVEEAIKRGIINSEQDLLAEEYKVEEITFSWFPKVEDEINRTKIRKSIARSFVLGGVIPLVFGLVKMNNGTAIEGSLMLAFGLLWIFCSSQLIKFYQEIFVRILIAGSLLALTYILKQLIPSGNSVFMDYFIAVVLFVLINYGLLFLHKINRS